MAVIKMYGNIALKYASKELRADKDIFMAMIKKYGDIACTNYASENRKHFKGQEGCQ